MHLVTLKPTSASTESTDVGHPGVIVGNDVLDIAKMSVIADGRIVARSMLELLRGGEEALSSVRRMVDDVSANPALSERLRASGA